MTFGRGGAVQAIVVGGPPGVGALIVRDRRAIEPLMHGGGQQFGLRPGTENVPGIVALAKAVERRLKPLVITTRRARRGEGQDGTSLMRAEIANGKAYARSRWAFR